MTQPYRPNRPLLFQSIRPRTKLLGHATRVIVHALTRYAAWRTGSPVHQPRQSVGRRVARRLVQEYPDLTAGEISAMMLHFTDVGLSEDVIAGMWDVFLPLPKSAAFRKGELYAEELLRNGIGHRALFEAATLWQGPFGDGMRYAAREAEHEDYLEELIAR